MARDQLVRSKEAAAIVGVSVPALHKSHDRFLKPVRDEHGHRLYLREAVTAYSAARDAERAARKAWRA